MNTEIIHPHTVRDLPVSPTNISPVTPPSTIRKIFIGKDGLRAGWSILTFISLIAGLLYTATVIHHILQPPTHTHPANTSMSLTFMYMSQSIPLLAALVAAWIMSRIERRRISVYGLGDRRKVPHFFAGLFWGVSCLSLLILGLRQTGLLVIDSRLLFGSSILRYGLLWLLGFLLVGLLEEYVTRGYLQYTLTRGLTGFYQWAFKSPYSAGLGFWTSAAIFSVLFGLSHGKNAGESPLGLLSAGLIGLVFCLSLWRTGSLWWAIGFHTSWDWAQSFLYGVADSGSMVQHHFFATHPVGKPILSGGATGPEGSIFIVPAVALIAIIIILTLRRAFNGYQQLPSAAFNAESGGTAAL
jgi:membrane protease YdiL (CAAX protease family)